VFSRALPLTINERKETDLARNPKGDSVFAPLQREPLLEAALPAANPTVRLVKGARIRFAPGQPTGLHRHPVSIVGVLTAGSFVFQPEGQEERLLKTGDSFFEPAGHTMLRFDNASGTEPAEIVCFYLTDAPDRPAIEMLAGGMDSQLGM
jgi:quercetin dioxygenase-like cupin family protein